MIEKFLKQLDVDVHVIWPDQKRIVASKSLSYFR